MPTSQNWGLHVSLPKSIGKSVADSGCVLRHPVILISNFRISALVNTETEWRGPEL